MSEDLQLKDQDNPTEEQVKDESDEHSDEDELAYPSASLLIHNYLQHEGISKLGSK